MKIVRFTSPEHPIPRYGMWHGDHIRMMETDPFSRTAAAGSSEYVPVSDISLLSPCMPTKIVAVGLNYRDHAAELGMPLPDEPLIFLKPPSSVTGPGREIILPEMSRRVDYEAELGVVIKKRASQVGPDDTDSYILGYTCLNDVTARDLQKKDVQFTRSKSFDTFCPVGPWIETELDPSDLSVQSRLNGKTVQASRTNRLIHSVSELVSFISHCMTLEPGDLIATGTPRGVGPMKPGDEIEI